jgi:hypothetical protein
LKKRYSGAPLKRRVSLQAEVIMAALRLVLLFVAVLALTGCAGPNYAPYDNMTNSYG